MIELIGTNAGLVWNVLNEGGKMSFKAFCVSGRFLSKKQTDSLFYSIL